MRWGLLGHPGFVGAVAVLAVNDHVLKPLVGSWWTGKLSDVAGVLVMTVIVGVVTGRPRPAGVAVAGSFVALKLVPSAAVAAAPLLGGLTRTDATDLVALVAVMPAVRLVERAGERPGRGLGVVAGVVAVLATTATSCYPPDAVDGFVVAGDGSVAARLTSGRGVAPDVRWAVSGDGGRTWRPLDVAPEAPPSKATEGCVPTVGCFRTKDAAVLQRDEGSDRWRTAFAFTGEQRDRMSLRSPCGSGGDLTVVAVVERADGDHVVVGVEGQGVLHRRPDGHWERRAVLDLEPISTRGPTWLATLLGTPLLVIAVVPIIVLLARPRRRNDAIGVALGGGGGLFALAMAFAFFNLDYVISGPLIAGLSVVVFVVSLVVGWRARRSFAGGDGSVSRA